MAVFVKDIKEHIFACVRMESKVVLRKVLLNVLDQVFFKYFLDFSCAKSSIEKDLSICMSLNCINYFQMLQSVLSSIRIKTVQ